MIDLPKSDIHGHSSNVTAEIENIKTIELVSTFFQVAVEVKRTCLGRYTSLNYIYVNTRVKTRVNQLVSHDFVLTRERADRVVTFKRTMHCRRSRTDSLSLR